MMDNAAGFHDLQIGCWTFDHQSKSFTFDAMAQDILRLDRDQLSYDEFTALFSHQDWTELQKKLHQDQDQPSEIMLHSGEGTGGQHICFTFSPIMQDCALAQGYVQDVTRFVGLGAGGPIAILSRGEFMERGQALFMLGRPYAILMIDVSLIKSSGGRRSRNDFFEWIVRRLRLSIRNNDLIAQLGDNEFALVLIGAGAEAARRIAQRVNGEERIHPVGGGSGSFYIGYTVHNRDDQSFRDTLERADQALYMARSGSSNNVLF